MVPDRLLVRQDIKPHAGDRLEILRIGLTMGLAQLFGRDPYLSRLEGHAVDPPGVVEYRLDSSRGDIAANPLHDLPRC